MALRVLVEHIQKYSSPVFLNSNSYKQERESKVSNDKYLNLSESIADATNIKIPKGSLIKFLNGVPDKKSPFGRRVYTLEENRISAIYEFLSDDSNLWSPLLSVDLLDFYPDIQAPQYLMEFFGRDFFKFFDLDTKAIEGTYIATKVTDYSLSSYRLTMEKGVKDGYFLVNVTEYEFCTVDEEVKEINAYVVGNTPDKTKKYRGWAVISESGTMLIFLKSDHQFKTHIYHSMGLSEAVYNRVPLREFSILEQNSPLLFEDGQNKYTSHSEYLESNLLIFSNIFGFDLQVGKHSVSNET